MDRQTADVELLVVRSENAAKNVETLGTPHRLFTDAVPTAERMSRADVTGVK